MMKWNDSLCILSSMLTVPKIECDELDTIIRATESHGHGGLVDSHPDGRVGLIGLQQPGRNLQVSRLGEEAVQLIHQEDVLVICLLPDQHHQLVVVNLETLDKVESSGGSQKTVLDNLAGETVD